MHIRTPTMAAAALGLFATAASAQPPATLQARMSAADFKAAGLDQLTVPELAHLDAWLAAHPTTVAVPATGMHAKKTPRQRIEARIAGAFSGWNGQSRYTLDNGQTWQQAESGVYACPAANSPQVTVKPMAFGSWLMYVAGCNQSVRVAPVQ